MASSETELYPHESDRTLVVMAKAPRPGKVKTRLSRCLAENDVIELYRCLLEDTLALGRSVQGVKIALMCPASDVSELSKLLGVETRVVPQSGQGLAAALTSVFAQFAVPGGGHRVIAFNSDSPHLPASVLASAFDLLLTHDLVVGPTHDGGYYLVGANTAHTELFHGDGMGTESALDGLLSRARKLQLSIAFTDPFYDVDIEEDLARLAADLRLDPTRALRTAEWLKEWQQEPLPLRSVAGDL